jgi:hypothetical protein
MPKDYSSPFTPGQPVPLEFFEGRREEIEFLRKKVITSTSGRLQVIFMSGDRGIGKTSLASFVRHLAEKETQVLGIHTFLGGVTSLTEMTRRIFDRFVKENSDKQWYGKVVDYFADHVREIGLFGITLEFDAPEKDLEKLSKDFAPALQRLIKLLKDDRKGILLILDDINGLSKSPEFADWLKSLVDEIAVSRESLPLCILLVGLEERRQELIKNNQSLARVFDQVDVKAWSLEETYDFYINAFKKVGLTIDETSLNLLTTYAGGYPTFAHEIGDAAFNKDTDNHIDDGDALVAIVHASIVVGEKYLDRQVLKAMRSERYHTMLSKIASLGSKTYLLRKDIIPLLNEEEKRVFHNFLTKMKKFNVLIPDEEHERGAYRFSNILYSVYFMLEARRPLLEKRVT